MSESIKYPKNIPKKWRKPVAGFDPWLNPGGAKFDLSVARSVVNFFPDFLCHSKGEWDGKPFYLEEWQQLFVGHLFAWKNKDGTRRFRKAFLYVPRKNGKTQLAAGIICVVFVADGEPGAEVYCIAADKDQANIVFREATNMVELNDEMSAVIKIKPSYRLMELDDTNSICRVLSSDGNNKDGYNPHAYIIDEVHAQKSAHLMGKMESAVGTRRNPLGVYLSTADEVGDTACNEILSYAKDVRSGLIDDPTYFPVIYETEKEADWRDEEVWKAVNPNYGISLKPEWFRQEFREACNKKSKEISFKRDNLNMQTEAINTWLELSDWDICPKDHLFVSDLDGLDCYGGFDLGSTDDLTALALYFPDEEALLLRFYVPEDTYSKHIEYKAWSEFLTITPGRVADYEYIRADINSAAEKYNLLGVGYDPWQATQLAHQLSDDDGLPLVEFRQGYKSLSEPSKSFEKIVKSRRLCHFGNPVLRWMASNCKVQSDPAGNIKPVKENKSSRKKIDGIIAAIIAFGLSIGETVDETSIYVKEKRGLITL